MASIKSFRRREDREGPPQPAEAENTLPVVSPETQILWDNIPHNQLLRLMDELFRSEPVTNYTEWNKREWSRAGHPTQGVYVFYQGDDAMCVGRSNSMLARLKSHANDNHYTSGLAFRMLIHELGYEGHQQDKPNRATIQEDNAERLDELRNDVKGMAIRTVEVWDQQVQMLLEDMVAVALNVPFHNYRPT